MGAIGAGVPSRRNRIAFASLTGTSHWPYCVRPGVGLGERGGGTLRARTSGEQENDAALEHSSLPKRICAKMRGRMAFVAGVETNALSSWGRKRCRETLT